MVVLQKRVGFSLLYMFPGGSGGKTQAGKKIRNCGPRAAKKGSSGNSGGLGHEVSVFISLFAQRNEPKKGPPVSLVPPKAGFPEFMPL
jgi:hypothetical protein